MSDYRGGLRAYSDRSPGNWDAAIANAEGTPSNQSNGGIPGTFFIKGGDILDRLPEASRAKLIALRDERDAAFDLLLPMSARRNEALKDKHKADQEVSRLRQSYRHAWETGYRAGQEDSPARLADLAKIEDAEIKAQKAADEYRRQDKIYEHRAERRNGLGQLLENTVERWVASVPANVELVAYSGPVAKPRKGESLVDAVERVRSERAKLLADLVETRCAPVTTKAAKAIARADIERLAAAGAPNVFRMVEGLDKGILWPTAPVNADIYGHAVTEAGPASLAGFARGKVPDGAALTAWLFKDQLIAAIERDIDALDDGSALTDDQRTEREFELSATLNALEHEEESLIIQAHDQGHDILRRVDADPAAVLGVVASSRKA